MAIAVSINPIDGNNFINGSNAANGIVITGAISDSILADLVGQTVSVALNGKTYTGVISSDGSWSVNVGATDLAALTNGTDLAGNKATSTDKVVVNKSLTSPTVSITTAGGLMNQVNQTISGSEVLGGAAPGATVSLYDNGSTTVLATATLAPDGSCSPHSIVAKDTDAAGNSGNQYAGTFQLSPQALPSIIAVTPGSGSNLGQVTLNLTGKNFASNDQVQIIAPDGTIRSAKTVYYVDNSKMLATFDFSGLPTGTYDVAVQSSAAKATLTHSLLVTNGSVGQFNVNLVVPANLAPGKPAVAELRYVNTGSTDIMAPIVSLAAQETGTFGGGSGTAIAVINFTQPTALSISGIGSSTADSDPSFLATDPTGPAGILEPGASVTILKLRQQ